ncbi:MAG: lactate racemase domain-containing protein [Sphaerochaetaceae bacterium]|nr:lactate racemase domain-containing protein [Sphaerochaetaceae bacterium]
MIINHPFDSKYRSIELPDHTQIVRLNEPETLSNAKEAIVDSLNNPIDSEPLTVIASRKLKERKDKDGKEANAVIVVSDNTRPVPYIGEQGILLPIIEQLFSVGYTKDTITILIANGTHSAMSESEIERMLDERILKMGIRIVNHNCKDYDNLTYLGKTKKGTEMYLNSLYVNADLKIATGLVESHFMAGASGGRKAICPGIIGEQSTYVFHGVPFMADENSRDLNLEKNLVHEEAVEVASTVGIDFLVNVTLNGEFKITGIFSGNFIKAHLQAVECIKKSVMVGAKSSDIIVTHAGFVGMNHYQCAKCAVGCLGILKKDGYLVIIADTHDEKHPVGGVNYQAALALLTLFGPEKFTRLIKSEDWPFVPEQWQVQMWTKVFEVIDMDHLIFYSPTMDKIWWPMLPGFDGGSFIDESVQEKDYFYHVVNKSLQRISQMEGKDISEMSISWIEDGPYVIPVVKEM